MSKAEEKAFKAYPKMSRISEPHGIIPADNESHYIGDANVEKREGFIEGYHQAEKDLALTWKDIEKIDNLLWNLSSEWSDKNDNVGYFQEVLNRFNKLKK